MKRILHLKHVLHYSLRRLCEWTSDVQSTLVDWVVKHRVRATCCAPRPWPQVRERAQKVMKKITIIMFHQTKQEIAPAVFSPIAEKRANITAFERVKVAVEALNSFHHWSKQHQILSLCPLIINLIRCKSGSSWTPKLDRAFVVQYASTMFPDRSSQLNWSRCEDLPITFVQMECNRPKSCSNFAAHEMASSIHLQAAWGWWDASKLGPSRVGNRCPDRFPAGKESIRNESIQSKSSK